MPASSFEDRPLLNLASYGRKGPARRDDFSPAEIDHIRRTVQRKPEVMVKVLTHGGQDMKSIGRHFDYLSRKGDLDIETDDGKALTGEGAEQALLEDWDLDAGELRRCPDLAARKVRNPPKLVHKLMFSMPAGTPADKVSAAVQNFAREEFGLQRRYAMVLHTDEPHPHVHVVVKATSERDGVRLNIKKATLRAWRSQFAAQLRKQGVAANATERAVRGLSRTRKIDGIYRAAQRGYSSHLGDRIRIALRESGDGRSAPEPGRATLLETRRHVTQGWLAVSELLGEGAFADLARSVRRFIAELPPARTEREWIAANSLSPPELGRNTRPLTEAPTTRHIDPDRDRVFTR